MIGMIVLFEIFQSRLLGHVNVERQDIGFQFLDKLCRFFSVFGHPDHFKTLRTAQDLFEKRHHARGVVHTKHAKRLGGL